MLHAICVGALVALCAPKLPPLALADSTDVASVAISCTDVRSGISFPYQGQHVLASGARDSAWVPSGADLCMGSVEGAPRRTLRLAGGGACVAWVDSRSGDADIYLTRLLADGTVAPGWPAGGLAVAAAVHSQDHPSLAADGAGGVFVAWHDFRGGRAPEVRLQHLAPDGTRSPGWPLEGVKPAAGAADQFAPELAADGAGGVFVAWQDRRSGVLQAFAAHVAGNGAADSAWAAAPLASAPGVSECPAIAGDGAGHALALWRQVAPDGSQRLLARRLTVATAPDTNAANVIELSAAAPEVSSPAIFESNGAFTVAWTAHGSDSTASVRAQRLAASGSSAGEWGAGGVVLSAGLPGYSAPVLTPDGSGGVLAAWEEFRGGTSDVYVQRASENGAIASGWPADGVVAGSGAEEEYSPEIASDGAGGARLTWSTTASSASGGYFRAQWAPGEEPVKLLSSAASPARARLTWRTARTLAAGLTIERRIEAGDWASLGAATPDDSAQVHVDDRAAPEGARVAYRLVWTGADETLAFEPVELVIPGAPRELLLRSARFPVGGRAIEVVFALPRGTPPRIELFDVSGRRIESREYPGLEPGEQHVSLDPGSRLASGIYFLRLSQGSVMRNARVVVVR